MAESRKRTLKEAARIELRLPQFIGYSDYFYGTAAHVQVRNASGETALVSVFVSGGDLIVPFSEETEVPFESAVELTAEGVFNPVFLSAGEELRTVEVTAVLSHEKKELSSTSVSVTVLPYDWWEGLSGNAERLAGFVRPKIADCTRVLSEAGERLKKWKESPEFYGYAGADKNAVRRAVAAVFAALRGEDIERDGEADLSSPLSAVREGSILRNKKANILELAVFAAASLEAAGLHPGAGARPAGCGRGGMAVRQLFPGSRHRRWRYRRKVLLGRHQQSLLFLTSRTSLRAEMPPIRPPKRTFGRRSRRGSTSALSISCAAASAGVRPCPSAAGAGRDTSSSARRR